MLAVFWGDADTRGRTACSGSHGSGVFYRAVDRLVDTRDTVESNEDGEKLALDAARQYIFARADAHARLRDDEFEVSSAVIITWHKMRPYPYWSNNMRV